MRVFVLGTGRTGSTTMVRAFEHAENLTAGHESLVHEIGDARFAYPDDHVEADMRLAWFLGHLQARFPDAVYVHMTRDRDAVRKSFLARWERQERARPLPRHPGRLRIELSNRFRANGVPYPRGIIRAFGNVVVSRPSTRPPWTAAERRAAVDFYIDTVDANVAAFLRDKDAIAFPLEQGGELISVLWERVGAIGDLEAAQREFGVHHNAEVDPSPGAS